MRRRTFTLAALGSASVPAAFPADATGTRVALVVGNGSYKGAPLPNAPNDADAVARALSAAGFEVTALRDASKARMEQGLAQIRGRLRADTGTELFYYAGHGIQLDWRNYLVPVDAELASAQEVMARAFDLQSVLDTFRQAAPRFSIVVIDACRDNPFGSTATARGLAPMDAPPGTYLAYATAPGNVAEDGAAADGNSVYTGTLVRELQRPRATIEEVFRRVRLQVRQATRGRQVPWDVSTLEHDFVFTSGTAVAAPTQQQLADEHAAQRPEWERAMAAGDADSLTTFLLRHPTGPYAEVTRARLEAVAAATLQVQPGRDGLRVPVVRRFSPGDLLVYQHYEVKVGLVPTRKSVERVKSVDANAVQLASGAGVLDPGGAIVESGRQRYTPPYVWLAPEPRVGKRWSTACEVSDTRTGVAERGLWYMQHHIAGLEDIQVMDRPFKAFRIEVLGTRLYDTTGRQARHERTCWVDTATLVLLREDSRRRGHPSSLYSNDRRELVEMRLA